jgi:flagellar biosynthesis GTPase FlhF
MNIRVSDHESQVMKVDVVDLVVVRSMNPNIEKLDDVDVVFVDTSWTDEERNALSTYLKKQKLLREKRAAMNKVPNAHA